MIKIKKQYKNLYINKISIIVFLLVFLIQISLVSATDWGTGGTITYDGNYVIHTFLTSGSFNVTSANNISILIVAGGGAGGTSGGLGGGGGAGGLIYNGSYTISEGNYTVTVGNGGNGGNGGNSSFGTLSSMQAKGGGLGGDGAADPGNAGGSGGGGAYNAGLGGIGFVGQGNNGGTSNPANNNAGGGGGAGAVGGYGNSNVGGNGGNGLQYSINGTLMYYAGGGGAYGTVSGGAGGLGGGGAGNVAGINGLGGGGGYDKSGGSGVVIIRYIPSFAIVLNAPTNNYNSTNNLVIFNCSATTKAGLTIQNISLLTNITGTWEINETQDFTGIGGQTNYSIFTKNIPLGTYNWTCQGFDSAGNFQLGQERLLSIKNLIVNSQTYNIITYETASETFTINVTANSGLTATSLIYDGTSYAGTNIGSGIWSRTIDIPTGSANKNFYWNFTYAGTQISSTTNTQTVNYTNFSICGETGGSVRFLNITFLDESNSTFIPATIPTSFFYYWLGSGDVKKNFTYVNNIANLNYSFCGTPAHKTFNVDYTIQYEYPTNYPQRTISKTQSLTNTSTLEQLYLLSSSDGIYVTFQIINQAEQTIGGAHLTATRVSNGVLVGEGDTGADGGITLWLNPDFVHIITVNATGYNLYTTTITPTQTSYTISLSSSAITTTNDYSIGISYLIKPIFISLLNDTTYNFNFTLTSNYWDVESFGFNLTNEDGNLLGETSASSNGGIVSLNLNTGKNQTIIMNYYWTISGNLTYASTSWLVIDLSSNQWSIWNLFSDLGRYLTSGMFGLDNFGMGLIMFFTIFIITGIFSYKYGINNYAVLIGVIWGLVALFDIGLNLIPNPVGAISHFPTWFIAIIAVGMFIKEAST